ncbi:MAG: hypothetical protein ACK5L3_05360, partial [Oscillospiraceae bacterium]
HHPFTVKSRVRFPAGSPKRNLLQLQRVFFYIFLKAEAQNRGERPKFYKAGLFQRERIGNSQIKHKRKIKKRNSRWRKGNGRNTENKKKKSKSEKMAT